MLTLIIGGARSGKSRHAQALCQNTDRVVYVATARLDDTDDEMLARIARHARERPQGWQTVEEPYEVTRAVSESAQGTTLLVDCLTVWIANLSWRHRELPEDERATFILGRVKEFARAARERETVAVTNEVGAGVVPDNPLGRFFRDLQGLSNQLLAREADRVVLVVAGLPLVLKEKR